MTAESLLEKYVRNSEKVFSEIQLKQDVVVLDEDKIREIIDYAKKYLSDAKYYGEKREFETGLVAVAYCEGLLDTLRLLGMVEFTWSNTKEKL
jgi:FAD synthetase